MEERVNTVTGLWYVGETGVWREAVGSRVRS